MNPEKKHIVYTAADILQYLSGKLSPSEMHAMEKAALDDPFLAEAIEGYAGMQERDFKEQLLFLKEAISKTPAPKTIAIKQASRFTSWRIAAAILLLCTVIGLTYIFTNKELSKNNSIVATNKKQDSVDNTERQSATEDSVTIATEPVIENTTINEQQAKVPAYKKNPADSQYINRSNTVVQNSQKQQKERDSISEFLKRKSDYAVTSPAPAAANDELKQYESKSNNAANKAIIDDGLLNKKSEVAARKFNAVVVGTSGSPVPFANVQITNKPSGTYADVKGNFSLQATDSVLKVEIKSVGYNTGNVVLRSAPLQNKIVLEEDKEASKENALKEVVVVGYGTKRKSSNIPDTTVSTAPVDGWDNYEKYIVNNLILSDKIIQQKTHGEVEVSFVVHNDGPISNLKIDKSLCTECDEAAIRVIKDGPSWKVKNGNKAPAKVKVKF